MDAHVRHVSEETVWLGELSHHLQTRTPNLIILHDERGDGDRGELIAILMLGSHADLYRATV